MTLSEISKMNPKNSMVKAAIDRFSSTHEKSFKYLAPSVVRALLIEELHHAILDTVAFLGKSDKFGASVIEAHSELNELLSGLSVS